MAVFFSFLSPLSVGGRIVFFCVEIVDGFLVSEHVFHQLLDGQLVNELARRFAGVLWPPFLSLCAPGYCLIHDNPVRMRRTDFSPCSFYHAFLLGSVCVWDENTIFWQSV